MTHPQPATVIRSMHSDGGLNKEKESTQEKRLSLMGSFCPQKTQVLYYSWIKGL